MAWSGDWVTPRLWGQPWFEKSPLLYWMSATGYRMGWGPELAPRLPVALLAVAFLAFYWWLLQREFGCLAASMATWILGTGAAWIGFGFAGVTDLPLAATFSAAMLLALPWIGRRDRKWLPLTAALLGVALLGKYGVAAVLAAPLAVRWRNLPDLLRPRVVGVFLFVAAPWYLLCYMRNGSAFVKVAWEHQFGRFTTGALGHAQPWWYYLPVLAGLLLPWTPLAGLLARSLATALPGVLSRRPLPHGRGSDRDTSRSNWGDLRRVFLLVWVAFGLVFFSLSVNKLPGYVLPLCPPLAALMGIALAEARSARSWLVACALLLVTLPIAVPLIPAALAEGLRRAPHPAFQWWWLLPALLAIPVWILETRKLRLAATAVVALAATSGVVYVKLVALPQADRLASARPLWRSMENRAGEVCVEHLRNDFVYGLGYYAGMPLPDCATAARALHVVEPPGEPPRLAVPIQ
jgi:4-amino-4-deoxy-L-arabinose transferase-like glycosyltransferase